MKTNHMKVGIMKRRLNETVQYFRIGRGRKAKYRLTKWNETKFNMNANILNETHNA